MARLICDIAKEINDLWPIPNTHSAKPYLLNMLRLKKITDYNGIITPKDTIGFFLALSFGFKGENAQKLKAELKELADTVKRTHGSTAGLDMAMPKLS